MDNLEELVIHNVNDLDTTVQDYAAQLDAGMVTLVGYMKTILAQGEDLSQQYETKLDARLTAEGLPPKPEMNGRIEVVVIDGEQADLPEELKEVLAGLSEAVTGQTEEGGDYSDDDYMRAEAVSEDVERNHMPQLENLTVQAEVVNAAYGDFMKAAANLSIFECVNKGNPELDVLGFFYKQNDTMYAVELRLEGRHINFVSKLQLDKDDQDKSVSEIIKGKFEDGFPTVYAATNPTQEADPEELIQVMGPLVYAHHEAQRNGGGGLDLVH